MRVVIFSSLLAVLAAACGAESRDMVQASTDGLALDGTTEAAPADDAGDDDDGDDDGLSFDLPPVEDPDGVDEECASVTESAAAVKQPADVLFVIDNSGSMTTETAAVQANMNGFSQQITDSGVDVHVTLISNYSICIDAPLGSGGCPGTDTNLPRFSHISRTVSSTSALSDVLATQAEWLPHLRSQAAKHVIIVTDDNSSLAGESFDAQFSVIEPSFGDYKLHGVVSMQQCPEAATIGSVYIELAERTGGVISDLCDQDFQPVFDLLSTVVTESSGLSCEYDIPEPPNGLAFNPGKVNVDFDDGGGVEVIGYVETQAECAGVTDGWHYDNVAAPTKIIACPNTCARFQQVEDATIDIRFGCGTVPAG